MRGAKFIRCFLLAQIWVVLPRQCAFLCLPPLLVLATPTLQLLGHRVVARHLALQTVSFIIAEGLGCLAPVGNGTLAASATASGCLRRAVGAGILDLICA